MTNFGKSVLALILLVLVGGGFAFYKFSKPEVEKPLITNFEECKNAGFPVMESYPEQCRDDVGNLFVRVVENTIPEPTPVFSKTGEFGKAVTLKINEVVSFYDSEEGPVWTPATLSLKEINDSRCKPNVQCIWAGELSAVFMFHRSPVSSQLDEVRLGTVNNKSVIIENFNITLESATETTATIVVSQKVSEERIAGGYIKGQVNIGPFCPVEREGEPCKVPPEAYTSREVVVYLSDKVTVQEKINLDSNGNYKIAIGPGSYFIQIVPAGIGEGEKKFAVVKSFETTTVDFDIDTGIR